MTFDQAWTCRNVAGQIRQEATLMGQTDETPDRQQVSITMEVEPGTDMDVIVSRLIDAVEDMSGVLAAWES
jgi:hypothetical protein